MPQEETSLEQTVQKEDISQYNYDSRQIVFGLTAIFLVIFASGFFMQAVNLARPKIAASLNGMALYAWSVSIPSLVSAFVILIFGKLSDMYGRRIMLIVSVIFSLIGSLLCIYSPNFVFFIAATAIGTVGIGTSMPLAYSVIGDMFDPVKRAKWIGLSNIPMGVASIAGPILGGWLTDTLGWQFIFWSTLPLLVLCFIMILVGVPKLTERGIKRKIDTPGCLLAIIASSSLIIGVSIAGDIYPWMSLHILGLLGISLIFWIVFIRAEHRAEEPILDPVLLHNRPFLTISVILLLCSFGQTAMMVFFPVFLQGIQGLSASKSGLIFTPFTLTSAFLGVPVGLLITKTKRYKGIFILGLGLLTVQLFGNLFLTKNTPAVLCILAATIAGFGVGVIPTVTTVAVQNAVPKRMIGAAMGALFFCLMMAMSISPAVLGSTMNTVYAKNLKFPDGLKHVLDKKSLDSLNKPDVLISEKMMSEFKEAFNVKGNENDKLFFQTVGAIRSSLAHGLRSVFFIGAITMLISFLLATTLPEFPAETEKT